MQGATGSASARPIAISEDGTALAKPVAQPRAYSGQAGGLSALACDAWPRIASNGYTLLPLLRKRWFCAGGISHVENAYQALGTITRRSRSSPSPYDVRSNVIRSHHDADPVVTQETALDMAHRGGCVAGDCRICGQQLNPSDDGEQSAFRARHTADRRTLDAREMVQGPGVERADYG